MHIPSVWHTLPYWASNMFICGHHESFLSMFFLVILAFYHSGGQIPVRAGKEVEHNHVWQQLLHYNSCNKTYKYGNIVC